MHGMLKILDEDIFVFFQNGEISKYAGCPHIVHRVSLHM